MDKTLSKLNDWLASQDVPEYICYNYMTDGTDEKIELLGVVMWDNLSVETYIDDDEELPVTEVVKRETRNLIANLMRISFKEFPK